MKLKTTRFDAADYLDSDAAIVAFIDAALAEPDPPLIADALRVVVRARGMTEIAREAGVPRMRLAGALADDSGIKTAMIARVLRALGRRLAAHSTAAAKRKRRARAKTAKRAA